MKILLTILAILYVLSPYDIVPDVFAGWGWIDDLVILFLLWRFFYRAQRIGTGTQGYDHRRQKSGSSYSGAGAENGTAETESAPKDPYTVLGLQKGASGEDIKRAYRSLANQYHPDKVEHLGEEFKHLAEKRFREIQQAYQALKKENA
jgi:hypothetical protein